ncbi:SDR family NAD(P)-dependent oxidoreductase [Chitinophaga rhizophila]|uniref:SDR family NAD(P)-dependent oxidoreductase n=1 Tax=Chitinophaga rhizophila TaxID=2866212 RepID=A0ABS7GBN9_9BACT|nr:SDR family NAD(P)-dependent oxidoreductase [Chitinophaga rhizophila]MBW8684675.1 SDR family NAD(P)-dependent oxidoreductase [Chitinophaga rhizophila]
MRTALVTGANKSIGFETAKILAQNGYKVFLGARDEQKGKAAVAQLQAAGVNNIIPVHLDVTDPSSVQAAKQFIAQETGSLDVLVNNAGILGTFPQPATTMPVADIREVFDTNFFGTITVTQIFLELLQQSKQPVIVNITSGLASLTLHDDSSWVYYGAKTAAYGPSKTALNAYTQALFVELKEKGFKVNIVDPGYTATDFNHHSGNGTAADAAAFVAPYAMLGADGPTGKYFSRDIAAEDRVSPW